MTGPADKAADGPSDESDLESKVFIDRDGKKLIRHLSFAKAAGKRPNSLRVLVGSTHGTALTLKNASFAIQYRRAVDLIAGFHGIPADDPLRREMEETAPAFLEHFHLHTQPFKFERNRVLVSIDDVAFPDETSSETGAGASPALKAPEAMTSNGLVRGITYRSAKQDAPAFIHVRLWRGKGFTLALENASFAKQYAKAVDAVANSRGLALDDPLRTRMHESGQAFLDHYRLATVAVTIPDVVVVKNPTQQP